MDKSRLKKKEIIKMIENHQITPQRGLELFNEIQENFRINPGQTGKPDLSDENLFRNKDGRYEMDMNPELGDSHLSMSNSHSRPIAIIGMSGRFPGAGDIVEYWKNLSAGKNCVKEIPGDRWDLEKFFDPDSRAPNRSYSKWGGFLSEIDRFDPLFFNISPREAELMDPQQRLFLQEAWKALEDAGYAGRDLSQKKCGVFAGFTSSDYQKKLEKENIPIDGYSFTGNSGSILAARISYFLNLRGPSITIDTACSSSLVAMHLASESIRSGTCQLALAGGVTIMNTGVFYIWASKVGMLSPGGECRTFDHRADGFVPGEGVGVVVMKLLESALQAGDHIYGVIKGSGLNQDGKTNGITAPSAPSQTSLECEVYDEYRIDPQSIGYIEAHGTGTKLGDPIEIQALTDAFARYTRRKQYCAIGSVKTNIGHALAAAGVAGVIKVLLCLKHRKLVPSLHYERANEHINFKDSPFYVNTECKAWQAEPGSRRRGAVSSFGFSGTNAHLVLEEFIDSRREQDDKVQFPQLVVLSARDGERLREYAGEMVRFLDTHTGGSMGENHKLTLRDLAYTLQVGREPMEERLSVVVSSLDDLQTKLARFCRADTDIEDFYYGLVDSHEAGVGQPESTPEKGEVGRLIAEKNLSRLGRLWVSGVSIDWETLYRSEKRHRVSLPTYPFAMERYWVESSPAFIRDEGDGRLHPLIDKVDAGQSLRRGGMVFRKCFKRTEPILRDHQVHRQAVLPGVAYLEMGCAVDAIVSGRSRCKLSRVVWLSPLRVPGEEKDVQVIVRSEGDHFTYQIESIEDSGTLMHGKGEFREPGETSDQWLSIEEIQARCSRRLDRETLYRRSSEVGINYGDFFRGTVEVWSNETESLGRVRLPSVCEKDFSRYSLHPGLLDSALQSIGGLYPARGDGGGSLRVPFSVEEVELLQPLPSSGYAYVKRVGEHRFHVAVLTDDGQVCVKLHDLSFRELSDGIGELCYVPRWHGGAAFSGELHAESLSHRKVWILYTPEGKAVEAGLSSCHRSADVFRLRLGKRNRRLGDGHREVDSSDIDGLARCLDKLDRPDVIYFLGGIHFKMVDPGDLVGLSRSQDQGVLSLFRLIKYMIGRGWTDESTELSVVTNDVYPVHHEASRRPHSAAIPGLIKSLSKEYPHMTIQHVDLSQADLGEAPEETGIKWWLRPVVSPVEEGGFTELVVRRGRCFRRKLEPVHLSGMSSSLFRERGVYLIVGGGGGIGLVLSRYLARRYGARLVLVGRSELSDTQHEKIAEIETLGGEVLYTRGDVGDIESMKEAVSRGKAQFGCVNGVVHSAIVLQDKTLENMAEETFRAALIPKVWGSAVLHRLFAGEELDFMMFFSSAQSFTCNAGQSNYAAGCTFKDVYASYIGSVESYPVKIINWGYWGSVGVVSGEDYNRRLAQQGVGSIKPEEGMAALERILGHRVDQVMVLKGEERFLETLGIQRGRIRELYGGGSMPAFPALLERVKPPLIDTDVLRRFEAGLEALNGLGAGWLLNAFRRMGVFLKGGERYESEVLFRRLGVIPDYKRLFSELLHILSRRGYVNLKGGEVESLPIISEMAFDVDGQDLEGERAGLVSRYPELSSYVDLLWVCVSGYPEVLTGKQSHMEVMFPGGSLKLVEGIYRGTAVTDYCNHLVAEVLKVYIDKRLEMSASDRIEILEVGAGTGGTSGFVLEKIKGHGDQVHYWYTDISQGFTEHGRGRFGDDYPFVEYRVLDIEKPLESQGFEPGSIDFLFSSNVFHATRHIGETLNQAKRLLKPGGLLLLSEATAREDFATLTFGLTEGWWRFEDEASRLSGSPLLSVPLWQDALSLAGLRGVEVLGVSGGSGEAYGHSVILGVSDGEVVVETGPVLSVSEGVMERSAVTSEIRYPEECDSSASVEKEPCETVEPEAELSETGLRQRSIDYVKGIFSEVLQIGRERIDANSTFERYGVDSLVGMEIIRRFERDFGKLPATLLFEHMSVEKLANYFLSTHRQRLTELCGGVDVLTEAGDLFSSIERVEVAGEVTLSSRSSKEVSLPLIVVEEKPQYVEKMDELLPPALKDTAIIGMSGRYPQSETVDRFWENLVQGRSCIREIPPDRWDWQEYSDKSYSRWGGFIDDVDKFDPLFFHISPREAEGMDPQERLFLEVAWNTLEDAGYIRRDFEEIDFRVGVFVGVMNCNYELITGEQFARGHVTGARSAYWSIANRVSYCFNFQGPSLAVDTACSSSLTAIHLACESLQRDECRLAVAGGVNLILHPMHFQRLCGVNMLSRDQRCKTFGEGADGFVDGEGVGAVLLKPFARAVADRDHIYGVIKGSSVNAGGKTSGYTVPNPNAQGDLIKIALRKTGIDPRTISYVEAHGTGTELGDPIEIAGLIGAYREHTKDFQYCSIGSVKSNIGHLESAAGIAALTKVLLQMMHGQLVPSIHSQTLNPKIDFEGSPFYVQQELAEWQQPSLEIEGTTKRYPRRAGISSFGAGGANAHVIVEEYESPKVPDYEGTEDCLIVFSARNQDRLQALVSNMVDFLGGQMGMGRPEISESSNDKLNKNFNPRLLSIIGDLLGVDTKDIAQDDRLMDYGLDIVGLSELRLLISEEFQIDLAPSSLSVEISVGELAQYVLERADKGKVHDTSNDRVENSGFTDDGTDLRLMDLAYTLQVGREPLEERLALVVSGLEELREKLICYTRGEDEIDKLYAGAVRQGKDISENLFEGQAGEAYVRQIIKNRDLDKIGRLWIIGVEIDWHLFCRDQNPRRISLPTYPFARKRYWVKETSPPTEAIAQGFHPLIDGVDLNRSLHQGLVFQKRFKKTDPVIDHHRVGQQSILPGVGYLEMAFAAGTAVLVGTQIRLARIVWLQPLTVTEESNEVQIIIENQNDLLTYKIQSKRDSEILIHSTGELHSAGTITEQYIDIPEIKSRCPHQMKKNQFYDRFSEVGIHYGEYFQGVSEVWSSTEEALVSLCLPPAYERELSQYTIHPGLIDSALQTIAGIHVEGKASNQIPMVTFSVKEVEIAYPLQSRGFAYAQMIDKKRFKVIVADETGRVCFKFQDVELRELPDPLENMFYVPRWEPEKFTNFQIQENKPDGVKRRILLVFTEASQAIAEALAATHTGDEVFKMHLGSRSHCHTDHYREVETGDYTTLDRFMKDIHRLDIIYFLGGLHPGKDMENMDALAWAQECGVLSLFRLIKTLGEQDFIQQPLQIKVAINDVHQVLPGDPVNPLSACMPGLCRSIAREYPWQLSCIDIGLAKLSVPLPDEDLRDLAGSIASHTVQKSGDIIAVRSGHRYKLNIEKLRLSPVRQLPFRSRGVYLIIGGTGRLGLLFARHLSQSVQARVILLGRSELSDDQREKIAGIESLGGEVHYLRVDITDPESMESALAEARSRFGPINGVIHSAVVLRDKILRNMEEKVFWEALAPKVTGSAVLSQVLKDEPLDFLLFFSSAQSFIGQAGVSNYSAASTFEDAFGCYMDQNTPYQVRVINWGYWGAVESLTIDENQQQMVAEYGRHLISQGFHPIEFSEGVEAVRRILAHRVTQVMPLKADGRLLEEIGVGRGRYTELYPEHFLSLYAVGMDRISPVQFDDAALSISNEAFGELARWGREMLLNSLQRMGAFQREDEYYEKRVLKQNLKIIPQYDRLFSALINILKNSGFVRLDGEKVIALPVLKTSGCQRSAGDLEETKEQLVAKYPDISCHVRLLWNCIQALPEILRGDVPATDIMFPHSSMELVEGIYKGNTSADYFNHLVVQCVQAYVQARLPMLAPDEKINILEVGAGTGGTSAVVLDKLTPYKEHLRYVYTDISMGFTQFGQKHYGSDYPFLKFGILNIEEDIEKQGFTGGHFDIVIAANVLHATRSIRRTLDNTKALLKTYGWLIFNELTSVQDFVTLTFGLLDGWWRFEDSENRLQDSPLLSPDRWQRVLREVGYLNVACFGQSGTEGQPSPQHVVVAESSGEVTRTLSWAASRSGVDEPGSHRSGTNRSELPRDRKKSVDVSVVEKTDLAGPVVKKRENDGDKSVENTIIECLAGVLQIELHELDTDKPYTDFGVDSILAVEIINRLNESFDIDLRTTDLFNYPTIRQLTSHIVNQYGQAINSWVQDEGSLELDASPSAAGNEHGRSSPRENKPEMIQASDDVDNQMLEILARLERGELDTRETDRLLGEFE